MWWICVAIVAGASAANLPGAHLGVLDSSEDAVPKRLLRKEVQESLVQQADSSYEVGNLSKTTINPGDVVVTELLGCLATDGSVEGITFKYLDAIQNPAKYFGKAQDSQPLRGCDTKWLIPDQEWLVQMEVKGSNDAATWDSITFVTNKNSVKLFGKKTSTFAADTHTVHGCLQLSGLVFSALTKKNKPIAAKETVRPNFGPDLAKALQEKTQEDAASAEKLKTFGCMANGQLPAVPGGYVRCFYQGDVHLMSNFGTADVSYDFMGSGVYTLAKSKDNTFEAQAFHCDVRTGSRVSMVKAIAVRSGQTRISVNPSSVINVNGKKMTSGNLLVGTAPHRVYISKSGRRVCMNFEGIKASYEVDYGWTWAHWGMLHVPKSNVDLTVGTCAVTDKKVLAGRRLEPGSELAKKSKVIIKDSDFTSADNLQNLKGHSGQTCAGEDQTTETPPTPEEMCKTFKVDYAKAKVACEEFGLTSDQGYNCLVDFCGLPENGEIVGWTRMALDTEFCEDVAFAQDECVAHYGKLVKSSSTTTIELVSAGTELQKFQHCMSLCAQNWDCHLAVYDVKKNTCIGYKDYSIHTDKVTEKSDGHHSAVCHVCDCTSCYKGGNATNAKASASEASCVLPGGEWPQAFYDHPCFRLRNKETGENIGSCCNSPYRGASCNRKE